MVVELSRRLEEVILAQANAKGVSPDAYIRSVLERDLGPALDLGDDSEPFETGEGILAKYGPAPSAEVIDENRREMFRGFGESF